MFPLIEDTIDELRRAKHEEQELLRNNFTIKDIKGKIYRILPEMINYRKLDYGIRGHERLTQVE